MLNKPKPPVATKKPKKLCIHNHERIDYYYWLREKDNPEVLNYLKAENKYTREFMKDTDELQDKLYKEITGRIKQEDQSVPYKKRGYIYYTRFETGKEYPVYCRKKDQKEATEQVLLNVNEMAEGKDFIHVKGLSVSTNNDILAFGIDETGRRKYTICFKELQTGKVFNHEITHTTGFGVWAKDNSTFFYCKKDPLTLRSSQVYKHNFNQQVKGKDELVFEETDESFVTSVHKSKSDKYIVIGSYSTLSDEYRILPSDRPNDHFKVFHQRQRKHEYGIVHHLNQFFIRTNQGAKNFKVMYTDEKNTGIQHWKELIPHREDVLVEGITAFKDYLVISERMNGLQQIKVIHLDDKNEHYIKFDEEAYTVHVSVNPEFETNILRIGYSSMTTPYSTYDYNLETREMILKKRQEVVGDFDPEDYSTSRIFATSHDHIDIPVTLVYHNNTKLSEKNPLLLYGYGSYGHTIDPYFSSVRLSLLDRGFVYAIAHVRGGEIKGRQWYDDGKLLNKKNTFLDFISCAEHLIHKNYTDPSFLFAMGGSAGGLLMGAISNIRPDLFKGIIAAVPFVDVVTTMLDDTIPLTTGEYDEWGDPHEEKYYRYILSYSPYDNVKTAKYPPMLVTTGLNDSQVQYWEPAKWVAKLRDMKTDDNPLLLHTNMDAGHSGASGRFRYHRETAMEYAFILKLLNIND